MGGTSRTATMRGYSPEDMQRIIQKLPCASAETRPGEERVMPTYIGLLKLTDQGIRNLKENFTAEQQRGQGGGQLSAAAGGSSASGGLKANTTRVLSAGGPMSGRAGLTACRV